MSFKTLSRNYWSSRSKVYDKFPGHTGFEDVWLRILSLFSNGKLKCIDMGCGTGFISKILAKQGNYVICLDLAEGMLRIAKMKLRKYVNVDYVQADCEKPPIRYESIDLIVSRHVLWTLEKPYRALTSWIYCIRRNGRIVSFDGIWRSSFFKIFVTQLFRNIKYRQNIFLWMKYLMNSRLKTSNLTVTIDMLRKFERHLSLRIFDISKLRSLLFQARNIRSSSRNYYIINVSKKVIKGM